MSINRGQVKVDFLLNGYCPDSGLLPDNIA